MKLTYRSVVGAAVVLVASMIGVAAQQQPTPAMPMPGVIDHVEGRIAFLKAELKITDAQLPQWNTFADALRSDARRRAEMLATMRQAGTSNALDRLDRTEKMLSAMVETVHSTKAAFGPLYAVLSDEQKKMADSLLREPMMGGL